MSTLDEILADVDSVLEVTVEIDSADRTDGTLKTWYFSTSFRETGSSETPANTTFLPYLKPGKTLGPLVQSLSEDLQFSGTAEINPGSLILLQSVVDSPQLTTMSDYVFAGYSVRIMLGRNSDSYASFALWHTVTISVDPSIQFTSEGLQATFRLSSAYKRMLEEPLEIKRYLGIPHCLRFLATITGSAGATKQSGHDVSRFTVGIKFRLPSPPPAGTNRRLWTKSAATGITSNAHWFLRIEASGALLLISSSNSAPDINHTTSTNLCDGAWHSVIFSRDDSTTAYLMIDSGDETVFTPLGNVNLSNFNLIFGESNGATQMDLCDARFMDRYMTPDEARSYFATRSNGGDLNCIGLWRFDDNTGATVNDYSSLNADATISGVLNTNYSWKDSDLGEPELAGRSYPLVIGNVLNVRAHLIDTLREHYRGNNDVIGWVSTGSNNTLTVRSQGTVLTGGGVDYTTPGSGGDGVFTMTSAEAEPITFDLLTDSIAQSTTYPSKVAQNLLSRTDISSVKNYDPLMIVAPWSSGYYTESDTTAQQALSEILGGSGLFYREDRDGGIYLDMLLPPTGYGPYGEPAFDWHGQTQGMSFGDVADLSGSGTVCGWVKVHLADQTAFEFGSPTPNPGTLYLLAKQTNSGNFAVYFQAVGTDAGKLAFKISSTTLLTSTGVIAPYTWHFFAAVFDDTANTMKIYIGPKGGTLVEVASTTNILSPTTNSSPLSIGGGSGYNWFSVQHLQVWNSAKNLSALQSLMATPPIGNESGLLAYIPLNEGIDIPREVVTNTTGTLFDTVNLPVWAPRFTVNLDETPSVKLTDFHHIDPRSHIIVKYAKNRFKMEESDIDTGVSQNNRLALTREGLDVKLENSSLKSRFKNAKKIIVDSPLIDQESAQRLLRVISNRFSTDRYVGTLQFPSGLAVSRMACGLVLNEEIGLVSSIYSALQTQRSFRAVSIAPNPLQLSTTVTFMG